MRKCEGNSSFCSKTLVKSAFLPMRRIGSRVGTNRRTRPTALKYTEDVTPAQLACKVRRRERDWGTMAKKSRMSVLKRQREARKAEKAALKRERRDQQREDTEASGNQVATKDDLAGYGFVEEEDGL